MTALIIYLSNKREKHMAEFNSRLKVKQAAIAKEQEAARAKAMAEAAEQARMMAEARAEAARVQQAAREKAAREKAEQKEAKKRQREAEKAAKAKLRAEAKAAREAARLQKAASRGTNGRHTATSGTYTTTQQSQQATAVQQSIQRYVHDHMVATAHLIRKSSMAGLKAVPESDIRRLRLEAAQKLQPCFRYLNREDGEIFAHLNKAEQAALNYVQTNVPSTDHRQRTTASQPFQQSTIQGQCHQSSAAPGVQGMTTSQFTSQHNPLVTSTMSQYPYSNPSPAGNTPSYGTVVGGTIQQHQPLQMQHRANSLPSQNVSRSPGATMHMQSFQNHQNGMQVAQQAPSFAAGSRNNNNNNNNNQTGGYGHQPGNTNQLMNNSMPNTPAPPPQFQYSAQSPGMPQGQINSNYWQGGMPSSSHQQQNISTPMNSGYAAPRRPPSTAEQVFRSWQQSPEVHNTATTSQPMEPAQTNNGIVQQSNELDFEPRPIEQIMATPFDPNNNREGGQPGAVPQQQWFQ